MTSYPPQPPVRRLTRSRSNKMLGGVCAGVATYLNMDVTLVRILTVVLSLFTGIPIIAYIVCLLVVPEEDAAPQPGPPSGPRATGTNPGDPVWGAQGAPWDQSQAGSPAAPPAPSPFPSPEPGPSPEPAPEPVGTEPDRASEPPPNEADPTIDEPLPESEPIQAQPGEQSAWESAPADPGGPVHPDAPVDPVDPADQDGKPEDKQ
jgi:phage shock protein PspC (stress-responsive transcriptional regulator)